MFKRAILVLIFILFPKLSFGNTEFSNDRFWLGIEQIPSQKNIEVVFRFVPKNGWYIHSHLPGEFGLPAQVVWNNENVDIISEQWSEGEDISYQGLNINAFTKNGLYTSELKVKNLQQKISADVIFMSCQEECIPEKEKFEFFISELPLNKDFQNNKKSLPLFEWNIKILLFAFLGGLILNIMPCVFPVLFIKIIGLLNTKEKTQSIKDAFSYLLGIIVCFFIIAWILVFLKNQGHALGWGFQLQSPVFLLIMIGIFFILGLMFLDVINFNFPIQKIPAGSFFTGLLAVLIASPCTAPFMGAAIGWGLTAELSSALFYGIFLALGIGYGLPFFLAGIFPNLIIKILPRPGKWMLWIKRLFAVPMFLTCIWLIWVLQGNVRIYDNDWQKFDQEKIQSLINQNQKVFIDYSAKWCITCLANEKAVLNTQKFLQFAKEKNINLFRADWTDYNPKISKSINSYNRSGVPLYIYFYEKDNYLILPQILTFGSIQKYLE